MSLKEKLLRTTSSLNPADFPDVPKKIEALRKIWRKEIMNFLDALTLTRAIVEPHLLRIIWKLESITDPGKLAVYCSPTDEGMRFAPIADDIDIALSEASLQIYDEFPESGSPEEVFGFMRRMYKPYMGGQFENWLRQYD